MRKAAIWLLCILLIMGVAMHAAAEEIPQAEDISASSRFTGTGYKSFDFLTDMDIYSYGPSLGYASITVENVTPMGSLYILFDLEYGEYTITDNTTGDTVTAGADQFIHEFIDLAAAFGTAPTSVTLDFANGIVYVDDVALNEPYINSLTTMNEGNHFPLTVEDDCVFVLGDNRGVSRDSRDPVIGQVDKREILGKAIFLMVPGTSHGNLPRDTGRIGVIK